MLDVLRWWLIALVFGVVALPYSFRLFPALPDRGVTAARALGLVLVAVPLWLGSVAGATPFTAGSITLITALWAAGGLFLAGRDRHALVAHLRARLGLLLTAEAVFAVALFGMALLRAYSPDIAATEKPFEFTFFNGVLRSEWMPAADPWFGGEPMSYYYGGYLLAGLFTLLADTPTAIAFNVALAMAAAMTALGAFGLGANGWLLLRRRAATTSRGRGAITAGLAATGLLCLAGNLQGLFEFTAARGWGSVAFYQRLGVLGFPTLSGGELATSARWYPVEHWYWWRATRLGSAWNILEFPFFSFMLGDLHAHVMVLPLTLLGLTVVLNLLATAGGPSVADHLRRPARALFLGALTGLLALTNSWDQPTFLLLLSAAALLLNVRRHGASWWATARALSYALPVAALSFLLYLPYFAYLSPATEGIRPVELARLPEGVNGEGMVLPPQHLLLAWGPLLLVAASGLVLQAARRRVWRARADDWTLALTLTVLPLFLWAAAVIGINRSAGALVSEIGLRAAWWTFGSYWLVQLALLALIVTGVVTLLAEARRPQPSQRPGLLFAMLTVTVALALIHVIELFYVKEPTPSRTNTLFKFSYSAWLLLALGGGVLLVDVARAWRPRRRRRIGPLVWRGAVALVLLVSLVYPVTAGTARSNGFQGKPSLDGLAYLRQSEPDEYAALMWLADSLPGRPLILESAGGDYSLNGRVSGVTGFPTVIGWPFHVAQQRGGRAYDQVSAQVASRQADVARIYQTTDIAEAVDLLRRYRVDYVYVGRLEREAYGSAGLAKFASLGSALYRGGAVTIYQLDRGALDQIAAVSGRP